MNVSGTLDEKIYQRQLMKGQIADMMETQGAGKGKKAGAGSRFSVEELKELFKLRLDTASDTHDLLCKGSADTGTSLAHSLTHSLTHSRNHALTHSLTHSLTTVS